MSCFKWEGRDSGGESSEVEAPPPHLPYEGKREVQGTKIKCISQPSSLDLNIA